MFRISYKNVTAPNLLMPPKKFQPKILPKSKQHCATVLPASISNLADDDYLAGVLEQEDKDGRFATVENKQMSDNARRTFLGIHRNQMQDETQWLSRQVHINLGFTLFAAAALGVDVVPLEGVDMAVLDQEFGLAEKGYRAVAVVALGYRAEDDFNAKLPKSRLENEVIFTKV